MPKEKSPAFQWYPKDCDVDENVRAMDDRQYGFYARCLNHAWVNNGLPADVTEIMRIIGRPKSYINSVWPRVGKCFVPSAENPSRLVNPRQEEERKKQREWSDKCRTAGRRSGESRRTTVELPLNGSCDLVRTKRELNANTAVCSLQFAVSEERETPAPESGLPWFDSFRSGYERTRKPLNEEDWKAAATVWVSKDLEAIGKTVCMELREYIEQVDDLTRNGEFSKIKFPANWLSAMPWTRRIAAAR